MTSVVENKNKLTGTYARNIVRIALIIHIILTSFWPNQYIKIFEHLATRIVIAVLVVMLLFWDVIAGALLAILLVLTVQESKSRNTSKQSSKVNLDGPVAANQMILPGTPGTPGSPGSPGTSSDAAFKLLHMPELSKELEFLNDNAPELKRELTQELANELIAEGIHGQLQAPQMRSANERVGAYMEQIGELGITKQINAGHGITVVDGVPSVKVNMGQSPHDDNTYGMMKWGNSLQGFQNMSAHPASNNDLSTNTNTNVDGRNDYSVVGPDYIHPANKTMSENIRVQDSKFITDKNLLDAQINSVSGLDGSRPPCAVESASGIWNAQGFGGIARALDDSDCPHSFV